MPVQAPLVAALVIAGLAASGALGLMLWSPDDRTAMDVAAASRSSTSLPGPADEVVGGAAGSAGSASSLTSGLPIPTVLPTVAPQSASSIGMTSSPATADTQSSSSHTSALLPSSTSASSAQAPSSSASSSSLTPLLTLPIPLPTLPPLPGLG